MRAFLLAGFVFAAAAAAASTGYAQQRDAGSKIRGEAGNGTSDAVRTYSRGYVYAPAPVAVAQPQQAVVNVAPAQPEANATAAVDNARTGTRTFSVEPQSTAPSTTYRTYAPRRLNARSQWNRADRKILGHNEY
ncbi:MAG: hypothetical protein K8U03_02075 [Planctomycetia bacterium]|nr:hypothetical protein [Planctomycetia bacterium]